MRISIVMTAILVAAALAIMGCGTSTVDTGGSPAAQPYQAQPVRPAATSPTEATAPADTGQAGGAAAVSIVNLSFQPAELTVKKGTDVTFKNDDSVEHTVTFGTDDKSLQPGETYSKTFDQAGTFDYNCSIHPSMTGKIIVQ